MALPLLLSARECLISSGGDPMKLLPSSSAPNTTTPTPTAAAAALRRRLAKGLRLSRTRRFLSPQSSSTQPLLWLDLDNAESRHLLCTTEDGGVALYDVARLGGASGRSPSSPPLAPVAAASGGPNAPTTSGAHRAAASGCCWYPVDSGAFVTCGHDGRVVVWDTNALAPAAEFSLLALRGAGAGARGGSLSSSSTSASDAVAANAVAMSPIAAQHCLVAAAAGDGTVRLCDAASGAVAHTLGGGGGGGGGGTTTTATNPTTIALAWSRLSEYELSAGDALGRVLVWDVRRAGPRAALDSRDTDVAAAAAAAAQQQQQQRAPSTTTVDPWSCRAHDAPVLAVHAAGPGAAGSAGDGLLLTAGRDGRVAAWNPRAPHRRVVAHFSGAGAGAALSRHRWDVGMGMAALQQQQAGPAQQQQQQQNQQSVGAGAARGLCLSSDDAAGLLFAPAGRAVYAYGLGPLPDDRDGGATAAITNASRQQRPSLLVPPRPPPPPALGESVAALREGHYAGCAAVCWNAASAELYSAGLDGALLVWAAEDDDEEGGDEEEQGASPRATMGRNHDDSDWARGRALLRERRRQQRRRGRRRHASSTPAWLGLGGEAAGRGEDAAARAREARRRRPAAADRDDWSTSSGGSSSEEDYDD